ncbi:dihydrodipicolinate synthetase [Atractiella rhizophila]|nr:dihydrodipicolinate synthetase [Atractiella rhizophila]
MVQNNTVYVPTTLPSGVYVPLMTFFEPGTEEVDVATTVYHAIRMAKEGLGLVVGGSMGEGASSHLTHQERNDVLRAVREALDREKLDVPLIAGTGAGSTLETIQLCKEAHELGATHVMVITGGYYAGALDRESLRDHFVDVAAASPSPVVLYNYPGASAGIDLDSDLIEEIANLAPNVVGVKLTCGSVGKLSRLTNLKRGNFVVLGGFADFLLPSAFVKAGGCITGLANVFPKTVVRLNKAVEKVVSSYSPEALAEAQKLQEVVSLADGITAKTGISGNKWLLEEVSGYGGAPRRPLRPYKGDKKALIGRLEEILALEGLKEGASKLNVKELSKPLANGNGHANGVAA